jgi:hypothetical protein
MNTCTQGFISRAVPAQDHETITDELALRRLLAMVLYWTRALSQGRRPATATEYARARDPRSVDALIFLWKQARDVWHTRLLRGGKHDAVSVGCDLAQDAAMRCIMGTVHQAPFEERVRNALLSRDLVVAAATLCGYGDEVHACMNDVTHTDYLG